MRCKICSRFNARSVGQVSAVLTKVGHFLFERHFGELQLVLRHEPVHGEPLLIASLDLK